MSVIGDYHDFIYTSLRIPIRGYELVSSGVIVKLFLLRIPIRGYEKVELGNGGAIEARYESL